MCPDLLSTTAAELQQMLSSGQLTSVELVRQCHQQMLKHNDWLRTMISISPLSYTTKIAAQLDVERRNGSLRGPLHGIPLIVKDALDTSGEFEIQSTGGGWAFEDCRPRETAQVIRQAVDAGLILVGKANLTEFGNWKGTGMTGGWSARGGQNQSAYVKSGVVNDGVYGHSNPLGSSSGSGVAVSAGFAPISIGTDFNGSLTNPAIQAALYTLRATPGTVSDNGGFPFSVDRDSVGPMAKDTTDLVDLLNVMLDRAHPEVPKAGYSKESKRQWKDISIAFLDPNRWHFSEEWQQQQPGTLEQIIRETLAAYDKLREVAKKVVGPVELMSDDAIAENNADVIRLIKNDYSGLVDKYIAGLETPKVKSLKELIAFNEEHRELELPSAYPNQDKLIESMEEANSLSPEQYAQLDEKVTRAGGELGIDKVLREHDVDIIIGPADSAIPDVTSFCRYPSVTLPLSYLDLNGRPFGLLAMASKFQDELLLDVARAWEATFPPRRVPPLD